MVGGRGDGKAQALQPLDPKAAQEYASDSEKAARGDPDAAYRMGRLLESGRLGGVKNPDKALMFYKLAAQKGHQQAAARLPQLEAEMAKSQKQQNTRQSALQDTGNSRPAP
jgi:TPR repeat protein